MTTTCCTTSEVTPLKYFISYNTFYKINKQRAIIKWEKNTSERTNSENIFRELLVYFHDEIKPGIIIFF